MGPSNTILESKNLKHPKYPHMISLGAYLQHDMGEGRTANSKMLPL